MKIHLTFGAETKEGYESYAPAALAGLPAEAVDEISGHDVLEKVDNLHTFMEDCFRVLKWGEKAQFTSQYYATNRAWTSPLVKRGITEASLNFANKAWRDVNKYTELAVIADFDVVGNFGLEDSTACRAPDVRQFWISHYNNVVQSVLFSLTKTRRE